MSDAGTRNPYILQQLWQRCVADRDASSHQDRCRLYLDTERWAYGYEPTNLASVGYQYPPEEVARARRVGPVSGHWLLFERCDVGAVGAVRSMSAIRLGDGDDSREYALRRFAAIAADLEADFRQEQRLDDAQSRRRR